MLEINELWLSKQPREITAQYRALEAVEQQQLAASRAFNEARNDALRALAAVKHEIARLDIGFVAAGAAPIADPAARRAALAAQLPELEDAVKSATTNCDRHDKDRAAVSNLYARANAFLRDAHRDGRRLVVHAGKAAVLGRGESWPAAIRRLRAERETLRAERSRIAGAVVPMDERKARARAAVAQLRQLTPDVDGLSRAEPGPIRWPVRRLTVGPRFLLPDQEAPDIAGLVFGWPVDAIAMFGMLFPDQLLALLDRELDATADDLSEAIPTADRPAMLARIDARLAEIERQEESLIVQAAADGAAISRRADADIEAALHVASEDASMARAAE